jgi:2-keto-4-pentenoate hydratase/2-oxohepta-3-ene-1,7-dioic acid hydratase in catechol pathway
MPEPAVVSVSNFRNMYWTIRQQMVHHTITGCDMRAGDLLGSGTISGAVRQRSCSLSCAVAVSCRVASFLVVGCWALSCRIVSCRDFVVS